MLVQSSNPKGIDVSIQALQTKMFTYLSTLWSLDVLSPDYSCYDRCYRNQTKDGLVPEVWNGNDYKQVFFDDKTKVQSFFDLSPNIQVNSNGNNVASVYLIFMVNLEIKGKNIRPDEEIRQDVQSFLSSNPFGFNLNSISIGLDNVFSDFNASKIKYRDMNPLHCFKFTLEKTYNHKDHICP